MKATLTCLVTLLGLAAAPAARAGNYPPGPRLAPDACGPGFYAANECGAVYGPNYCLHPGYLPWNGAVFGPKGCAPGQYPGGPGQYPGGPGQYPGGPGGQLRGGYGGPVGPGQAPGAPYQGPAGMAGMRAMPSLPGVPNPPAPPPGFPTHPFARSPRDFFMYYD